jgi:hypothetical protein
MLYMLDLHPRGPRCTSFPSLTSESGQSHSAAVMLLHATLLSLALCVHGMYVGRQADPSCAQFGTYPAYTGPCEATSEY